VAPLAAAVGGLIVIVRQFEVAATMLVPSEAFAAAEPPPDTLTRLIAAIATTGGTTATKTGGTLAPAATGLPLVQFAPEQFHPGPHIDDRVKAEGNVSVSVTALLVGWPPVLVTVRA
jgi:hypothetical protein